MTKLKLGLPAGSLQDTTIELFKKAGYTITVGTRSYFPSIDDKEIECILVRAQEIPKYVESGIFDLGLTGKDWLTETRADVKEITELIYAKRGLRPVKLVVAVPRDSEIKSIRDLEGRHIATEYVNIVQRYLKEKGIKADVEFSWGATEVKPPKLADAIVELTETGSSLKANNLKIIDIIMESTTRVVANKDSLQDEWKREKIDNIVTLLKGALRADKHVGIKMNFHESKLADLLKMLPSLRKPTVSPLSETGWLACEIVVEETAIRDLIPTLKKLGAEGIVEYPLNKIVH